MKEIKAYVHRNRVADVIAALKASPAWGDATQSGKHNLTVYVVKGSLVPLDEGERHYSIDLGQEVVNEYKIELLCEEAVASQLVEVIRHAAHTGQPNAGWVTLTDVRQAIPIS